jgi:lysophosphatidate acyltransferase
MLGWLLKPFTAITALAAGTVSLLSRKYERVRLYYHLGLYLSILGATSVWGVVLSIAATATGQVRYIASVYR